MKKYGLLVCVIGIGLVSSVFAIPSFAKIVSNYKIVYLDTDSSVIIKDTQYICNSTYNKQVLEAMAYLALEDEKKKPKVIVVEPVANLVSSTSTNEIIN